ncbi:MAG: DUF2817 domain-containing protein [Verrucomicrobiota bacterium]
MTESRNTGRKDVPEEERIDVADYLHQIERLAQKCGFESSIFAEIKGFRLPVLSRDLSREKILYVSSGVHGDEPAGPLAIEEVLSDDGFNREVGWVIFPVINPTGLSQATRETDDGIDLNRDYLLLESEEARAHRHFLSASGWHFWAALGLHEDWEASAGYIYEHNTENRPNPRNHLLEGLSSSVGIESGDTIDGWETYCPGVIHPSSDPQLREYWPEQVYLMNHHTAMSYTIETPSSQKLENRVRALGLCLRAFGSIDSWKV